MSKFDETIRSLVDLGYDIFNYPNREIIRALKDGILKNYECVPIYREVDKIRRQAMMDVWGWFQRYRGPSV